MGLMLLSVAWLAMACAVLGLAAYRKMVAYTEDDTLHLRAVDGTRVAAQNTMASRLEWVDRWGKILTVATVVFGILLVAAFLYAEWLKNLQLVP